MKQFIFYIKLIIMYQKSTDFIGGGFESCKNVELADLVLTACPMQPLQQELMQHPQRLVLHTLVKLQICDPAESYPEGV
jgi:hypothetical protein